MDILKDASATAIYGSRGSNGVVLITTKRGKTGKAVINLDTYYGLQKISKIPKFLNARQQAEYYYNSIRNRNIDLGNNVSGDLQPGHCAYRKRHWMYFPEKTPIIPMRWMQY
jgi:TonB-dependent SusC/RagA subfamily outer membrane receptor